MSCLVWRDLTARRIENQRILKMLWNCPELEVKREPDGQERDRERHNDRETQCVVVAARSFDCGGRVGLRTGLLGIPQPAQQPAGPVRAPLPGAAQPVWQGATPAQAPKPEPSGQPVPGASAGQPRSTYGSELHPPRPAYPAAPIARPDTAHRPMAGPRSGSRCGRRTRIPEQRLPGTWATGSTSTAASPCRTRSAPCAVTPLDRLPP